MTVQNKTGLEEFEMFWQVYPRKVAKAEARKAWAQTEKVRPPTEQLLKAVYAARASKQWRKDDGEYIPHASSFLRGERWDDQLEVDLSQLDSPRGRVCGYCGVPAIGMVNGIHHCREHFDKAMSSEKTKVIEIGSRPEIVDKKMAGAGRD